MSTLKQMMGVRQTTSNDLLQLELGVGNAKNKIKDKQRKYLKKIMLRTPIYVHRIIRLAIEKKTKMGKQLNILSNTQTLFIQQYMETLKTRVLTAEGTKKKEYRTLNPDLKIHAIYSNPEIKEHHRIAFTRARLSSHRLKIETGRWSRIPRENRICQCNQNIQTEEHALLECPLTDHLRKDELRRCTTLNQLFTSDNHHKVAELCFKVLNLFTN